MSRRGSHRPRRAQAGDVRDTATLKGASADLLTEAISDDLLGAVLDLYGQSALHEGDAPFLLLAAVELSDGVFQCRHVTFPADPPPRALIESVRENLARVGEGDRTIPGDDIASLPGAVVREVTRSASEVVVVFTDGRELAVTAWSDLVGGSSELECELRRQVPDVD